MSVTIVNKIRSSQNDLNNEIGDNYSDQKNFGNSTYLIYQEDPSLYAIGNTYSFNIPKNLGISITAIAEAPINSHDTQKVKNKQLSIFLGEVGDLRNIVGHPFILCESLPQK